jgi:hypothetical protein
MKINDENRKDGDILPSNEKLRNKLFQQGVEDEMELDNTIFSNPYLEIKTESWELFQKTGNVFIEFEAKYPEKNDFIPSGIQTTKSPVWVLSWKNDSGIVQRVVYCVYIQHLLETIKVGLEEGWVTRARTPVLPTGDINRGYLVPLIKLVEDAFTTSNDNIQEMLIENRTKHQRNYNPTEEDRNTRLKELAKNRKK